MEDSSKETAVSHIGKGVLSFCQSLGDLTLMLRRTLYWLIRVPMNRRNFLEQVAEMGARTSPVTSMTLLFTGMVLALQTGNSFIRVFNEPLYVGRVVGLSIVKELGPVLTAVVFSGRIGAAIAAELGTMKVTEQIDALYTLGTNPERYLIVPRFVAALAMVPILTVYSDFLGVAGGYIVAHYKFHIAYRVYWNDIYAMEIRDVLHGLIKSMVFAGIIVSISAYMGLITEGGAEGVGKSTTSAVVLSMIFILVGDYFLSALLVAFRIG